MKYPLAADATKNVSRDYGVPIENRGIALRGLFVIDDADGKLRSFAAGERGLDLLKATLDRVLGAANQAATS